MALVSAGFSRGERRSAGGSVRGGSVHTMGARGLRRRVTGAAVHQHALLSYVNSVCVCVCV